MARQAQLATGEILEFPDETPDAVMDATVKRHVAGAAPPPVVHPSYEAAAAANPLPEPYAKMRDFGYGAAQPALRAAVTPKPPPDRVGEHQTAANRAVYRAAGAPVDILASTMRATGSAAADPKMRAKMGLTLPRLFLEALNLTGGAEKLRDMPEPFGGSASIEGGAQTVGVPSVEPVDRQGRFTTRILEEVMSALIPAGTLSKVAQLRKLQGRAPDSQSILRPFADAPVREVVNQGALGASAGAGAAAATEALGNSPGVDILGALAGSYGGSSAAKVGGAAKRAAGDVVNPKRVARGEVGDVIVRSMQDKKVDPDTGRTISAGDEAFGNRLDESRTLEKDVPGLKLTTGEATTDPGLQALEYKQRQTDRGPFANRETENRRAVNTALEEIAPTAKTDAAARAALEKRRAEAGAPSFATSKAVDAREADVDAARRAAEPGMGAQEAGREIRSTAARGKEAMESVRDAEALPLLRASEERGAVIDAAPVAKVIDDKLAVDKRDSVRSALATARAKLLKVGSKDELDTSVGGLYEARKAINDIIEGRGEKPTDRFAKSELLEVRKALDAAINKGAPEFGEYLAKYAEDSRLVDPYKTGATKDVLKTPSDREAAARFWESPDSIDEFQTNLGGNKQAVKALRAYALDDALTSAANIDGGVDPKRLEAWVRKNQKQLDAFPGIREDLGNLTSAQKSLERAAKRKSMVEKGLNDPKRSTIAKYLDREDARDSIESILASKNPRREMTQLVNTLKRDSDALEGAKRAFWDRMMEGTSKSPGGIASNAKDAANVPVISNAAFRSFMAKHGDAAKILYADNPAHLKNLERISEAVDAAQRTTRIKSPGTSGTGQTLGVPGLTLAGMTSRGYAIARGVVSLPYVALETGARIGRRAYLKVKLEEVNKLLDDALLDPEIAKTLVMEWNANNQRVIARRLKLHLGHELEVGAAEGAEPEEPQATPKAVPATPAVQARIPKAPRDPSERVDGQVYQTPKGSLRWTGDGWEK